jgi:hypothetical protein
MDTETIKPKKEYRRTISKELHEQWRKLYRIGDSDAISKHLGLSKPTVDKALIYGNVHRSETIDFITSYFYDRLKREDNDAKRLQYISGNENQNIHGARDTNHPKPKPVSDSEQFTTAPTSDDTASEQPSTSDHTEH